MRIVINNRTEPSFNIAAEEYMMSNMEGDIFSLWRNKRCVIVGRNQNTLSEVNIDFLTEHDVPVVRRASGGGAVFHDLGNLCFTFITDGEASFSDFSLFTKPIVQALKALGLDASLSGRNDIHLNGKKISGNAQKVQGTRILHHGTLLFSSNLEELQGALKTDPLKIQGKGIKSVSERVMNISKLLDPPMDIEEFSEYLIDFITKYYGSAEVVNFSNEDTAAIEKLVAEKYSTWEWNFGRSSDYTYTKKTRLPCGIVEANLNIEGGTIRAARFYGDYFGRHDVAILENSLIGVRHSRETLADVLQGQNIENYFAGSSADEILSLLF